MTYPAENTRLAGKILSHEGCLISEYPAGTTPRSHYFVERDRLQSGLSQGVIVIEPGIKGGTMHTVKFARQQKRSIACIASHPEEKFKDLPMIQGNRKLISEGIAFTIASPKDIDIYTSSLKDEPAVNTIPEKKN